MSEPEYQWQTDFKCDKCGTNIWIVWPLDEERPESAKCPLFKQSGCDGTIHYVAGSEHVKVLKLPPLKPGQNRRW